MDKVMMKCKKIYNKRTNLLFKSVFILILFYQINELTRLYLNYNTILDIQLKDDLNASIPSLSLCFNPPEHFNNFTVHRKFVKSKINPYYYVFTYKVSADNNKRILSRIERKVTLDKSVGSQ